ncbi:MAG: 2-oxoacid:acceptor oxidoreductase family protein [Burkholderiaceae bacterium]|nr:2-oxoacid:acceptor oxidoreductase family protein [Burkholderiaceae bacterium]
MRTEIRFAGVGSQGMVSSSIVLAEALGIVKHYQVVQTQEYSASISGGSALGDVAFSDQKIIVPWVLRPDILVAMAQDAVKQHAAAMRPGTRVIVDDMMVTDVSPFGKGVSIHWAPMTRLADEVGFRKCANIVSLGVLARLTGLLTLDEMTRAVLARAPGRAEVNLKALRLGYDATLRAVAA